MTRNGVGCLLLGVLLLVVVGVQSKAFQDAIPADSDVVQEEAAPIQQTEKVTSLKQDDLKENAKPSVVKDNEATFNKEDVEPIVEEATDPVYKPSSSNEEAEIPEDSYAKPLEPNSPEDLAELLKPPPIPDANSEGYGSSSFFSEAPTKEDNNTPSAAHDSFKEPAKEKSSGELLKEVVNEEPIKGHFVAETIKEIAFASPQDKDSAKDPMKEESQGKPLKENTFSAQKQEALTEEPIKEEYNNEPVKGHTFPAPVEEIVVEEPIKEIGLPLSPFQKVDVKEPINEEEEEEEDEEPTKEDSSVEPIINEETSEVESGSSAVKPVAHPEAVKPVKQEEIPVVATTTLKPSIQNKPAALQGYEVHKTGNYKFNITMVTWQTAKETCESEGTHLAVVNSKTESKVLKKMFKAFPDSAWMPKYKKVIFASVGFHDMDVEGEYKTIFGAPLNSTGYTRFWRSSEPNNLGASDTRPGEDCGAIHRNGGLNDFFCSLELPFFCEQ